MRSGKGEGAAVTVTEAYQILELSPGAEMGGNKKEVPSSYAPDASGRIFFFRGEAVPSGTGTESGLCCS